MKNIDRNIYEIFKNNVYFQIYNYLILSIKYLSIIVIYSIYIYFI